MGLQKDTGWYSAGGECPGEPDLDRGHRTRRTPLRCSPQADTFLRTDEGVGGGVRVQWGSGPVPRQLEGQNSPSGVRGRSLLPVVDRTDAEGPTSGSHQTGVLAGGDV